MLGLFGTLMLLSEASLCGWLCTEWSSGKQGAPEAGCSKAETLLSPCMFN